MTQRWARMLVSVSAAAMLSVTMLGAEGQPAGAKQPTLSRAVTALSLEPVTAKIVLNPVAKTAAFDFGKAYKTRVVTLQRYQDTPATWVKVGSATRLSSSGKVTFKLTINASYTYRAVIDTYKKSKAKASQPVRLSDKWVTTLNEGFSTSAIGTGGLWVDRGLNDQVPSRLCSVPTGDARSVTSGRLVAGVAKYPSGTVRDRIVKLANAEAKKAYDKAIAAASHFSKSKKAAAKKAAAAVKKSVWNCPNGVFKNTAITTDGNSQGFTVNTAKSGILTARITFPKAQGIHGSVWLQSSDGKGGEIDFIESFGYGSGITSYVHVPKKGGGFTKIGGYVLTSKKNDKSWWAKAHDYSVEWTASTFTFRVDGAVTRTIHRTLPNSKYYLVASLLTSDWELGRLLHPIGKGVKTADVSKQKMLVDSIRVWSKA